MYIGAFSLLSSAAAVLKATGVTPTTFPPENIATFAPRWLEGYDLIYIKLHGMPDQPYWYGDGFETAISKTQIEQAHLNNCICFVANCHASNSAMEAALLQAGAFAVISGPGENYSGISQLRGADALGAALINRLKRGEALGAAFANAKRDLGWLARMTKVGRDTLGFQLTLAGEHVPQGAIT